MKRVIILFFVTIVHISNFACFAQNLYDQPESVAYDSLLNRYFVSNYGDGTIVEIDSLGNEFYMYMGLGHCFGNCISDNVLYVSAGTLKGIDLVTHDIILDIGLPCNGNLDGMTADTSGHLYVVDTGGKIFKIYLESQTYSIFVSSGLAPYTQDIIFDAEGNRLLAAGFSQNAPIQAINLEDSTVTPLIYTTIGYYDGITMDQYRNIYLASHLSGGIIYKYDPLFIYPVEIISSNQDEPAGLDYNKEGNILAVPNFGGDSVDLIPINQNSVKDGSRKVHPNSFTVLRNYPNPFNASTAITFTLDRQSDISLDIYNVNGEILNSIVKGVFLPGDYSFVFNANELTSGVYFARLKSGQKVQSSKLILSK